MSESTDYFTPHFLRARIRRSWRDSGLIEGRSGRPGLSITEVVKASKKRNRSLKIKPFEIWIIIYDEYLSWFVSFFTVTQKCLDTAKKGTVEHDMLRCFLVLTSKIISDLFAIRHLCVEGFDIAAKTLLRSTIEYIDILTIVAIEPSIGREFVDTESNEDSNNFWSKYLRGGKKGSKARRLMRKAWVKRGLASDYQMAVEFDKWFYEYSDLLMMSSHPSWHGGALSNLVMGGQLKDGWLGMFGAKGEISTRTLHEAIKHITKFLYLSDDTPFRCSNEDKIIMEYQKSDELQRHTKLGRDWLFSFYYRIVLDARGKSIFFSEIDISDIWPDIEDSGSVNLER